MLFTLKKCISTLLMPLGLCWLCLLAGLCLIKHQRRFAQALILLSLMVIFVFGNGFVSYQLVHTVEKRYPPLQTVPSQVLTVVVLGGGIQDNPELPANQQLGGISTIRLLEGIRCAHLVSQHHKTPQLILSGGAVFGNHTEAHIMASVIDLLGLAPNTKTEIETKSRDTADQARFLQKRLGSEPFILVTSASHMPRSMMLFEQLGMHPIAGPADRHSQPAHGPWLLRLLPNANNLATSDSAIHEYLGYIWSRWVHPLQH